MRKRVTQRAISGEARHDENKDGSFERRAGGVRKCWNCQRKTRGDNFCHRGSSGVKEAQVELFRQAVAELDTHIQQLITDSMMTP